MDTTTFCTKKYFNGVGKSKSTCGNRHHINEWMCYRCLVVYKLHKDKRNLAITRLAVTLDAEEETRLEFWLNGANEGGPNELMGSIGEAVVTQGKFAALRQGEWLNDEVVNASLYMYKCMHSGDGKKPSHVFPSFFYTQLVEMPGGYCYEHVRRWTRWITAKHTLPHIDVDGKQREQVLPHAEVEGNKWLNLFLFDKVFIPINIMNSHWFLTVLVMDTKEVRIIDSVGGDKSKYFDNICAWLRDEGLKVDASIDRYDGWRLVIVAGPMQDNGTDCGVFTIVAAEMCMLDLPLVYDQPMMPALRTRIAHELIGECLK